MAATNTSSLVILTQIHLKPVSPRLAEQDRTIRARLNQNRAILRNIGVVGAVAIASEIWSAFYDKPRIFLCWIEPPVFAPGCRIGLNAAEFVLNLDEYSIE